jgi:mono/diheme cytochrome c family protein
MKITHKFFALIAVLAFGLALISMSLPQQAKPKPWDVPANFKSMKNPVASNPESINLGSALYKKNCASCHGKVGIGDGVKARTLATFPGDFSGAEYQTQTDGEHFYKTKEGRGDMPAYKGKIVDEDIWNIVNYMRTFKK